jgi:hypothetical protein
MGSTASSLHVANKQSLTMASSQQPIKQYEIYRPSVFHDFRFEIRQNGHAIALTRKHSSFFKGPQVHINLPDGTTVAAVKVHSFSRNLNVYLGNNPDAVAESQWMVVDCSGWMSNKYTFGAEGRNFAWTRYE